MRRLLSLPVLLLLSAVLTLANEHDHVYSDEEEVVLWMNTVGPYHNRQETYSYFSLPFCQVRSLRSSHLYSYYWYIDMVLLLI